MSESNLNEVTVIVRSIGERTTEACETLLEKQVPAENVTHVKDLSAPDSVFRPYEIGIAEDRTWTLVVDADMLPNSTMVEDIIRVAEKGSTTSFAFEAHVRDKFFGGNRIAGNTLYKTRYLNRALDLGKRSNPEEGRPESAVINLMSEEGYEIERVPEVVGIHDYEQYYKDIFRTAHGYYNNHKHYVPILESYWQREDQDDDFRLIRSVIENVRDRGHSKNANISDQFDSAEIARFLSELRLTEKDPLNIEDVTKKRIDRLCRSQPTTEFHNCQSLMDIRASRVWSHLPKIVRGYIILYYQIGLQRSVPWLLGNLFATTGNKLKQYAEGDKNTSL